MPESRIHAAILFSFALLVFGFSFVTPTAQAISVEQMLMNKSYITGMDVFAPKPSLLKISGLPKHSKGLLIVNVVKGMPADNAGIKTGDLIQKVNGIHFFEVKKIREDIKQSLDRFISFEVLRQQKTMTFTVQNVAPENFNTPEQIKYKEVVLEGFALAVEMNSQCNDRFRDLNESFALKKKLYQFHSQRYEDAQNSGNEYLIDIHRHLTERFK